MNPENEDRPGDDADPSFDLFDLDDAALSPAPAGSLLGAIGQVAAAVLVVLVLVALFIGGAVTLRWIFG